MGLNPLKINGAGEGNRTLVISLEGCCSTIELHPPRADNRPRCQSCVRQIEAHCPARRLSGKAGGGGWIRTNVGVANGFTVRPL